MTDPIAARAELASRLAHHAGQTALGYFRNRASLEVETKNGTLDLVSVADRAVEEMIRAEIARAFPDDAILGEEGGAGAGTSGLTWVIDPIDGTVPFLMGLPHWCVVIAITEGQETLVGVTDVPVTGEHFAARKGHGATLDGVRLRIGASTRASWPSARPSAVTRNGSRTSSGGCWKPAACTIETALEPTCWPASPPAALAAMSSR